ncbi:hypothetical protein [Flavihumibacter profundi]|uniref:hypothetical protein n=1 Tax=Flavihumibacter profundi TaxID=2716883 RepID=UPI001CC72DCC|nr:hypothetical protein [Flavihumibacter profundi]MBZ5858354.1 hypothetical protein [Flavihumibacter profundi]
MKALLFFIMMAILSFSCNNGTNPGKMAELTDTATLTPKVSATGRIPVAEIREYKMHSGKSVQVEITHPVGMSLSNIIVGFTGDSSSNLTLKDVDPVNKILVADLDGNGFDEIYIITTAAGSGSYGNVYGFASNGDKSFSFVYLPEITAADLDTGGKFEGYEGHDEFEIAGKSLLRTFPVKIGNKSRMTITYKMKAGEAGYLFYITAANAY